MINWGTVPLGAVLPFPFATYGKTNGESITLTGLAVTDIEVYKGTTVTQRASDAGYALIDTDGIDIDTITGIHGFTIDTGDNTDAGFFVAGSFYYVVVSAVTVDAQTVNFIAGTFSLRATESVAGVIEADVTHFGGTAGTFASGRPEANTSHIAGSAVSTTAAQIGVNVVQISADAAAADNAEAFFDGTGYAGTNNVIPTVTTLTGHTAQTGDSFARLGAPAGASIAADIAGVQSDTNDIQTRIPAALTAAGNMKSDSIAIDGDTDAGDRLRRGTLGTTLGTCAALGTTTSVIASALAPASVVNDQWKGKVMTFDMNTATTALRGQSTTISAYTHATLTFTVTALTTAPASADTFTIS